MQLSNVNGFVTVKSAYSIWYSSDENSIQNLNTVLCPNFH